MHGRLEHAFSLSASIGMICPICGSPYVRQEQSLVCQKGHTVNGNRKGYFNFLSRPAPDTYGKPLFEARQRVFHAGLYDGVMSAVFDEIQNGESVLDVGCGEGTYLHALAARGHNGRLAGVDISRQGIEIASTGDALFCVADMRHLPFAVHSFDTILNILSPADYSEFQRVLKPSGKVIKVIPGPDYLKEVREARHLKGGDSQADARLKEKMHIHKTRHVYDVKAIDAGLWPDILQMTPLNQDLTPEQFRDMAKTPARTLTIDLMVLTAVPD